MELSLFSLFSYWVSAAYLAGWAMRQLYMILRLGNAWQTRLGLSGKVLSLKTKGKAFQTTSLFISLVGMLSGITLTYFLCHVVMKEWVFLSLACLGIVSEGWRVSSKDT